MITCKNCGEEFEPIDRRTKFCSKRCGTIYQKQREYEEYIARWKLGEETGTKANGFTLSRHVRRYLFEKYNSKCSRCGWNKKNPRIDAVILEIEHIDGDCTNAKEENLDLICPNCHSLTATYKALNYGNGNRNRLKYYKLI